MFLLKSKFIGAVIAAKKEKTELGTLEACCKPSSGANVDWMEIPLRSWVRLPATKNGDHLKGILINSYFTRVQIKREGRKTEEALAQQCGAQGRKFDPLGRRKLFWPFFASNPRDNDICERCTRLVSIVLSLQKI